MARQRYYLDPRVLTVFFVAAMPFVVFGSFVVVNMAKTQLRESVGTGLEQRAVQTKLALEQHLSEQLVDLRLLAVDPQVQQALASPSRPTPGGEAAATEKAWASGGDPKVVGPILDSPLASRLRLIGQFRPSTRALQIVDANGRLVAASARGGRLFHGESAWFKALAAQEGEPEAWVGDIQRILGGAHTALEIAFPVRTADGAWLGAVRALLDANDLYTVLAPVRVGRTGHAVLIRSTDGMILASDESERILQMTYPGFDSLRGAIEGFPLAAEGEALFGKARVRRGYWSIPEVKDKTPEGQEHVVEPRRLVGFSPIDQIPSVKWLIAVEQDLSEALAPIEGVTRYLWLHFLGAFLTIILLALYFSFKLEKPVMEEDLHLHEEHLPAGMRKPAEN